MNVGFDKRINPTMAKSQSVIRKTLSNPLVLFIGIAYGVLSIYSLCSYITKADNISNTLQLIPDKHSVLSVLLVLNIIFKILYPILIAVGFFLLFANSKSYPNSMIPKSGGLTLLIGVSFLAVCQIAYIIADVYTLFLVLKKNMINDGYIVGRFVAYIILSLYVVSFIAFVFTLVKNLNSEDITSVFSIFFGVTNVIIAVFILIAIVISEQQTMSYLSGDDTFLYIVGLFAYALMAAFAFCYRTAIENANDEAIYVIGNVVNPYTNHCDTQINFCPSCGEKISVQGQVFCGSCGYKLN